jgi:hypothetical protein
MGRLPTVHGELEASRAERRTVAVAVAPAARPLPFDPMQSWSAFRDIRVQSGRLSAQCCFPSARERAGGALRIVTDAVYASLSISLESRLRESLATKVIGVSLHRPCEGTGFVWICGTTKRARVSISVNAHALLSFDFVGLLTHPPLEHFDAVFTE